MGSDPSTQTSSQCLRRMLEEFLVLVERINGVSGVLRNASHQGQSSKVEVLKTSLVELHR
jgi:hypothetical protein